MAGAKLRGRWWLAAASIGAWLSGIVGACAGVPPCEKNSDCTYGHYCQEGECLQDCDPDLDPEIDCPKAHVCNQNGQCEFPGNGGGGAGAGPGGGDPGGGGAGGTATGVGGVGGTATGTGGTGGSPTGTGGGPTKGELDSCTASNECLGGLVCKPLTKSGAQRCTKACSSDAQCPRGTRCIDDGTGLHCLGIDVGRSCSAASQCNFACIQPANYCTLECNSGFDCPNGYGCMPVGNPAVNVCVRAEALCSPSDTSGCIAPAACDLSPNLILGSCTTTCNTAADCPKRAAPLTPWTCDGLCRRPADVFGPLPGGFTPTEWHCDAGFNPVVLCNDAQHINFAQFTVPPPPAVDCSSSFTTPGVAGDSCVNSCRYQGGCSHGYACVAVGGVGNERIGLCLPTGPKEPGVACSSNTECAFGYCSNNVCSRDCTLDDVCPGGLTCVAAGGPPVEGQPFKRCE